MKDFFRRLENNSCIEAIPCFLYLNVDKILKMIAHFLKKFSRELGTKKFLCLVKVSSTLHSERRRNQS